MEGSFQKFIVNVHSQEMTTIMAPDSPLPYSQEPAIYQYHKSDDVSSQPYVLLL
jgi:hypothetical protein